MNKTPFAPLLAALLAAATGSALAQSQTVYFGGGYININSSSGPLQGPPGTTPPNARLDVDDARTVIFGYQRYFNDQWGIDLAMGIPPKHKVYGEGALERFGHISSSKQMAPTLFANYRFGTAGDKLRPFVGVGINYTRFIDSKSTAAGDTASGGKTDLDLSDSWGLAAQAGVSYAITPTWSLNATVATARVKSDLTATTTTARGATIVRRTTIDFNPTAFTLTAGYSF
ncbi:outer membrane beta-barrel protein [Aquabacterium sp. A7-Y]|uniref:OmpW/AlkL family protein n=1 Tax=Aquabacterium sp. A7-Y TaxID=1349605 RepID=UPI00223CC4BD|nr:OmpW family outer membrane protein [Aquabacterium sp. A7-Y]MCW7540057.1 outer membrane beta-barrel protein [Aquabacterium sp. A7-Y]